MSDTGEDTKLITLRLALTIVSKLDEAKLLSFGSRSEYIRQAMVNNLAISDKTPTLDQINSLMSDKRLVENSSTIRA